MHGYLKVTLSNGGIKHSTSLTWLSALWVRVISLYTFCSGGNRSATQLAWLHNLLYGAGPCIHWDVQTTRSQTNWDGCWICERLKINLTPGVWDKHTLHNCTRPQHLWFRWSRTVRSKASEGPKIYNHSKQVALASTKFRLTANTWSISNWWSHSQLLLAGSTKQLCIAGRVICDTVTSIWLKCLASEKELIKVIVFTQRNLGWLWW